MSIFDLHMHSSYSSDGQFTPEELIKKLKAANIKVAALSDHNCMQGIDEMIEYGNKAGIQIIPCIEFNTLLEGIDVHLLGYQFDYHQPCFTSLHIDMQKKQEAVLQDRIDFFKSFYNITFDEKEILKDIGNQNAYNIIVDYMLHDPNNAHIKAFQPYLKGGERSDCPVPNFYWDTCSAGKPGYFPISLPTLKEVVDLIHQHGGIAIVAHPWKTFYQNETMIQKAIEANIEGFEAYSNYHTREQNEYYEQLCKKHNLLMTCGSDFHGKVKPNISIGEYGYTKDNEEEILQIFLQALKKGETQ